MTKMKIEIKKEPMNGWFIARDNNGFADYLHKDGTWNVYCGKNNFHKTRQDARDLLATLTEEEKQRPVSDDDYLDFTCSNDLINETGPTQEEIDEYLSDILLDCEEERKAIQEEGCSDVELTVERNYEKGLDTKRPITITIQIN